MKEKIMLIVKKICDMESTNCRNLNKSDLARELMTLANVPKNADIQEISDFNNAVVIQFLLPGDDNYYSLFAGIGYIDHKFYFELSIIGKLLKNHWFRFFEEDNKEDEILPLDYFVGKKKN